MNIKTNRRHKVNEKHQQQASSKEKLLQCMQSKHAKEIQTKAHQTKQSGFTKWKGSFEYSAL